jgi:hypothetical protein
MLDQQAGFNDNWLVVRDSWYYPHLIY